MLFSSSIGNLSLLSMDKHAITKAFCFWNKYKKTKSIIIYWMRLKWVKNLKSFTVKE